LPRIFHLALDPRKNIKELSLWVISELASKGPEYIDLILQKTDFVANIRLLVTSAAESQEVLKFLWDKLTFFRFLTKLC